MNASRFWGTTARWLFEAESLRAGDRRLPAHTGMRVDLRQSASMRRCRSFPRRRTLYQLIVSDLATGPGNETEVVIFSISFI
jgi:hypothetical protein